MADIIGPISGKETFRITQGGALVEASAAQLLEVLSKSSGDIAAGFTSANMARWIQAKAKLRAGVSDAVMICHGDSTTVGQGAGDNPVANFTNAQQRSMPSRVATFLSSMGLPATATPFAGGNMLNSQNVTLTVLPLYKPQIAVASNAQTDWYYASLPTLGGYMMNNSSGTGAFSLTSPETFNLIDVYYVQASGNGSFTVDIGGAALTTINAGSPAVSALIKASIPTGGAAATGTVNIKRVSGTQIRIIAIVLHDTGVRRVQVLNAGVGGARTGDLAGNPASALYAGASPTAFYGPLKAAELIDPDISLIKLGANNMPNQIPVDIGQADLLAAITSAKSKGGSCVVMTPTPMDPATRDPANLTTPYNAMVRQVALANGCGFIDLYAYYQNWAIANAQGYFADNVHGTLVEYANEGALIGRILSDV